MRFWADRSRAKARANGDKNKVNVKKAIGFDKNKMNFARSFFLVHFFVVTGVRLLRELVCPSHPSLL